MTSSLLVKILIPVNNPKFLERFFYSINIYSYSFYFYSSSIYFVFFTPDFGDFGSCFSYLSYSLVSLLVFGDFLASFSSCFFDFTLLGFNFIPLLGIIFSLLLTLLKKGSLFDAYILIVLSMSHVVPYFSRATFGCSPLYCSPEGDLWESASVCINVSIWT